MLLECIISSLAWLEGNLGAYVPLPRVNLSSSPGTGTDVCTSSQLASIQPIHILIVSVQYVCVPSAQASDLCTHTCTCSQSATSMGMHTSIQG